MTDEETKQDAVVCRCSERLLEEITADDRAAIGDAVPVPRTQTSSYSAARSS